MRKQVKKKGKGLKILLAVIIIIAVLAVIFKFLLYDKLQEKAFDMVTENIVQEITEENPQTEADVQQIINSVSEEDKDSVKKIINQNVSVTDMPEVLGMVKNKDVQGLKEYAKSNFSEDEIKQLKEIYRKYM